MLGKLNIFVQWNYFISNSPICNIYCSVSNFFFVPKPVFNVNFVLLIATSPINNQISCKMRVAIKAIPLYLSLNSVRIIFNLKCQK